MGGAGEGTTTGFAGEELRGRNEAVGTPEQRRTVNIKNRKSQALKKPQRQTGGTSRETDGQSGDRC